MPQPKQQPTRVLFVCVGNSCRSQMAEALARHWASDVIEPSSAGIAALGEIAAATLAVLAERGVRADGQYSKPLTSDDCVAADLIVNMTGRPAGTVIPIATTKKVVDWDVADPYGANLEVYRRICDEIDDRVAQLADHLRENPELVLGSQPDTSAQH